MDDDDWTRDFEELMVENRRKDNAAQPLVTPTPSLPIDPPSTAPPNASDALPSPSTSLLHPSSHSPSGTLPVTTATVDSSGEDMVPPGPPVQGKPRRVPRVPQSPSTSPPPTAPAETGGLGRSKSVNLSDNSRSSTPRRRLRKKIVDDGEVIEVSSGEETGTASNRLGRQNIYPMPPRFIEVSHTGRAQGAPGHAGEAAFWAHYLNEGGYREWYENVARQPLDAPALPPTVGFIGPEMGWAHSNIYTRLVADARRVVSMDELRARTASNAQVTKDLVSDMANLKQRLQHVREDSDSDSEDDGPRVPPVPPVRPVRTGGRSSEPSQSTQAGAGVAGSSRDSGKRGRRESEPSSAPTGKKAKRI